MEALSEEKSCPACGDPVSKGFEIGGYQVGECGGCGFAWVLDEIDESHVADVYGDAYFNEGDAGYGDYGADRDLLIRRGIKYGRLLKRFGGSGRLLDVGAAGGFLMEGFQNEGWEVGGIEPNDTMAAAGRERGLDLQTGSLEDFKGEPESFDAVSMVQVVAHFWDGGKAFDLAAELLRPGGLLLVETWDRKSVAARAFGKRWHEYSPPSTLRWFTRPSLRKTLEGRGLSEVASRKTVKTISFGHARSLASAKWKMARWGWKAAAWVPKGFPVPYLADDLFWAVFRKGESAGE